MLEAANQINLLKHKVASITDELENEKKEKIELSEQCAEKSRQKRKLEELYEAMKQKYEGKQAGVPSSFISEKAFAENNSPRRDTLHVAPKRLVTGLMSLSKTLSLNNSDKDRFALVRKNSPMNNNQSSKSPLLPINRDQTSNRLDLPSFTPLVPAKRPKTPLFSKRSSLLSSV